MFQIDDELRPKLGLERATKRQEHADLDAAIHALVEVGNADPMLLQRLKKKKLALKDRIIELDQLLRPDILA